MIQTKAIVQLKNSDINKLLNRKGDDFSKLKPLQWVVGPIRGLDNTIITAWKIFQLDSGGMEGDIIPVGDSRDIWDACEIVRSHNITLGFYDGE